MKIKHFFLAFCLILMSCGPDKKETFDFTTIFEVSGGTQTPTYLQVIAFYENLADTHTSIAIYPLDKTDSGKPLHLVTFNPNRTFESEFSSDRKEQVILINNGIHPGESDGIDASMLLMRDFAEGKIKAPGNTVIAVIPIYNIGGALQRNSTSRTNQNGPEAYGFRGNARNYDLNRDFIKTDTKNALAFSNIFTKLKPTVFIDTHVSNGADYQYTLTHLFTQHNKLGGELGNYLHTSLMPQLENSLATNKWDITPYVNVFNSTPEKGFSQFFDSPRYSTGYTTLYNTLGMMVETHMLKPYKQRVEGTYQLLKEMIQIIDKDAALIITLKQAQQNTYTAGTSYPIQWKIDSTKTTKIDFKGFEATMEDSKITGSQRLKYDTTKPYTKKVAYQNYFIATDFVSIPESYIIPQGYWNVIERLKANNIVMERIQNDTTITATVYDIDTYKTRQQPYEGHYLHYNTQVLASEKKMKVAKGDYLVNTQQDGVRYLIETLEPVAVDSFFNWNFFDTILQQKEGFSPYVWEDKALELLEGDASLKLAFKTKKENDPDFKSNWYAQLEWLHKQSVHYETSHLRYPIIRVGG